MRKIRITNEKNRDATVGYQSPKPDLAPTLGLASEAVALDLVRVEQPGITSN